MAESKDKTKEVKKQEPKKVHLRLMKDKDKYKDDVFVAINGKPVQIKRGVTVEIDEDYAKVLEQSMDQDGNTAELIAEKKEEFEKGVKSGAL